MSKLAERRLAVLNEAKDILDIADRTGAFSAEDAEKVEALHAEAETLERGINARAAMTPAPVAPTLLGDGASVKNYTMLRTADGREVKAFGKGQRMAAAAPGRHDGGLDLEGFGRALCAMITGNSRGAETELRALGGTNTSGGFFIEEQLGAELVDLARARSVMANAGSRVLSMDSDSLRLVTVTGDMTFSPVGEHGLIPSSDPTFGSALLVAKKHGVLVKVSNELLADGAGAGTAITNVLANAWAAYLDGLILDYLLESEDVGSTESVGALSHDDIIDARKAVSNACGFASHAIMNPTTVAALAKAKEATTNAYLQPPAALNDLITLETTGIASTSALVGDFSTCVIGQRGNMSIELSREAGTSFEYDQTFIRLLWRGDIGVLRPSHVHQLNGLTY